MKALQAFMTPSTSHLDTTELLPWPGVMIFEWQEFFFSFAELGHLMHAYVSRLPEFNCLKVWLISSDVP